MFLKLKWPDFRSPLYGQKRIRLKLRLTFSPDLSLVDPLVVEHLDAVSPVVRDEDLLTIINHHTVGELQVLGTAEFAQNIAHLKQGI